MKPLLQNSKTLFPLFIAITIAVFGAGIAAGKWGLFGKVSGEGNSNNASPQKEAGRKSTIRNRQKFVSQETDVAAKKTLERIALRSKNTKLSNEMLFEGISPDQIPDLIAELRERVGILGLDQPRFFGVVMDKRTNDDTRLLLNLLNYYYINRPEKAIKWLGKLPTKRERWPFITALFHELKKQHKKIPQASVNGKVNQEELLKAIRPLTKEFSRELGFWTLHDLYKDAMETGVDDYLKVARFEAEHFGEEVKGKWSARIPENFDFKHAMNEIAAIHGTMQNGRQLLLPANLYSEWQMRDPKAAQAWREENPTSSISQ